MPMVVVPVGFVMGPEFGDDGPDDREPWYWEVHLGGNAQQLSATEFSAWAAAFVDPPSHAQLAVNRQTLENYLANNDDGLTGPIAEPGPVVTELLERGLLAEFDPVDGPLADLFGGLRLFPQGRGLGSTPEEPQIYRIVFDDMELVRVSREVYRLWSYALRYPSLWEACDRLTRSDPTRRERRARELAAALPALVSAGAGFLDPARDRV